MYESNPFSGASNNPSDLNPIMPPTASPSSRPRKKASKPSESGALNSNLVSSGANISMRLSSALSRIQAKRKSRVKKPVEIIRFDHDIPTTLQSKQPTTSDEMLIAAHIAALPKSAQFYNPSFSGVNTPITVFKDVFVMAVNVQGYKPGSISLSTEGRLIIIECLQTEVPQVSLTQTGTVDENRKFAVDPPPQLVSLPAHTTFSYVQQRVKLPDEFSEEGLRVGMDDASSQVIIMGKLINTAPNPNQASMSHETWNRNRMVRESEVPCQLDTDPSTNLSKEESRRKLAAWTAVLSDPNIKTREIVSSNAFNLVGKKRWLEKEGAKLRAIQHRALKENIRNLSFEFKKKGGKLSPTTSQGPSNSLTEYPEQGSHSEGPKKATRTRPETAAGGNTRPTHSSHGLISPKNSGAASSNSITEWNSVHMETGWKNSEPFIRKKSSLYSPDSPSRQQPNKLLQRLKSPGGNKKTNKSKKKNSGKKKSKTAQSTFETTVKENYQDNPAATTKDASKSPHTAIINEGHTNVVPMPRIPTIIPPYTISHHEIQQPSSIDYTQPFAYHNSNLDREQQLSENPQTAAQPPERDTDPLIRPWEKTQEDVKSLNTNNSPSSDDSGAPKSGNDTTLGNFKKETNNDPVAPAVSGTDVCSSNDHTIAPLSPSDSKSEKLKSYPNPQDSKREDQANQAPDKSSRAPWGKLLSLAGVKKKQTLKSRPISPDSKPN